MRRNRNAVFLERTCVSFSSFARGPVLQHFLRLLSSSLSNPFTLQVHHFAIEYSGAEQQLLERVAKKYQLAELPTRESCEASGDYDQVIRIFSTHVSLLIGNFGHCLHP